MKVLRTYSSLKELMARNRAVKTALRIVIVLSMIALLAPLLANDKPLVCKYKGKWLFPAFSWSHQYVVSPQETISYNMGREWKFISADIMLFPPCAYSPLSMDVDNAPGKSPFNQQFITYQNGRTGPLPLKFRHWLGTTQNGNDVLSNMIYGARIAMAIGIFSMLIASLLGITLGACAGFFGNDQLRAGYISTALNGFAVFTIWFYGFYVRSEAWADSLSAGGFLLIINIMVTLIVSALLFLLFNRLGTWLDKKTGIGHNRYLPVDTLISKLIEVLNSIPALLLIITVSAMTRPSYTLLIMIIGLLSWTNIARLTRAEFLKAKQLDYVTSCRAVGMSNLQIMQKQILPNVLPVLLVQIIFGMGGAVLAEASLSFIGVGVPINSASWGHLLNEGRDHFSYWWLVLCPGICIFLLIFSYNTIAKHIGKTNSVSVKKVNEPE